MTGFSLAGARVSPAFRVWLVAAGRDRRPGPFRARGRRLRGQGRDTNQGHGAHDSESDSHCALPVTAVEVKSASVAIDDGTDRPTSA